MKKKIVLSKKNSTIRTGCCRAHAKYLQTTGVKTISVCVCVQRAVVCSAVRNIMCEFLNTATCGTAMMQWIFRGNIYYLGSLQCMPP